MDQAAVEEVLQAQGGLAQVLDGLGRRQRRMLLGDVAREDLERDAEPAQQVPAPRGGRGQDEDRRVQETIRGFWSVMTRSFFSIAARRNLGRLNECRCACPSQ